MNQRGTGTQEFVAKLSRVRLVILDVDGVLTDGAKWYGADGLLALRFHARDGLGVHLLQQAGIRVALVTNGSSDIILSRASDLDIDLVRIGITDKGSAVRSLMQEAGVEREVTLYVGDDLWDLPAFAEVGTRVAVDDAIPTVRAAADWVTATPGGEGAVREVADALLEAKHIDALQLLKTSSLDGQLT